jgi:hypothetical protein
LLQGKASKTKGLQGNKLAFPWIPLAESGLFNGLRRIQIKNFPVLPKTRPGCKKQGGRLLEAVGIHMPAAFAGRVCPWADLNRDFGLTQTNVAARR